VSHGGGAPSLSRPDLIHHSAVRHTAGRRFRVQPQDRGSETTRAYAVPGGPNVMPPVGASPRRRSCVRRGAHPPQPCCRTAPILQGKSLKTRGFARFVPHTTNTIPGRGTGHGPRPHPSGRCSLPVGSGSTIRGAAPGDGERSYRERTGEGSPTWRSYSCPSPIGDFCM